MNRQFLIFSLLSFCFYSTEAIAGMTSFVADAVQAAPGQKVRRGKLYVSPRGTRFEFTARKQKVIQIIQPSRGLFQLLFPKTKTYYEKKTVPSRMLQGRRSKTPCKPSAETECRKDGLIKFAGMSLERWVIKDKKAKRPLKVWWDPSRHMYIRQFFPDGSNMVAQLIGTRRFEGRTVEQWKMTVSPAGRGSRYFSYMLFAPDLGFPVMEQGSKGLVKELHNIKPQSIDASLYEIPNGYKKVTTIEKKKK